MWIKSILILGAGRSSRSLIDYLIHHGLTNRWEITVGDVEIESAIERIGDVPNGKAIYFNVNEETSSRESIAASDLVISLIPAHLHPVVAKICLSEGKHLLTASYVSDEMRSLHDDAQRKGLLFLNECGLDPGIDHMSAMQIIDHIKAGGGKLNSFESFTGGLIANETNPENPWRYKFTWNPRNVIMAGQSTAKYLQDGVYKYIPYQQLFKRTTPVSVPGFGEYEGYANRDSLKYLETYGLQGVHTMLRGTLRNKGYCSAWDIIVQLGCCEDSYEMEAVAEMRHSDFINAFLVADPTKTVEEKLLSVFSLDSSGEEMKRLRWSGFFSTEKIGLVKGTPAKVLEHILNKKWKLQSGDKDFVVMWHRFRYEKGGAVKEIQAYLTATGEDENNTAMSKTVGLPLAIAAKLLLQGKIKSRGVVIPVLREIYEPVLAELAERGIQLIDREV